MKFHSELIFGKLWFYMLGIVLVSAQMLGCRSEPKSPGFSEMKIVTSGQVALAPGDIIDVKFFYTPELSVSQTVRPDGKITLQLIGDVDVEGKNPAELRKELIALYKPYLKTPEIAVVVQSFRDRRVFVGGQVMAPGVVDMPGKMDVLEAIMQVGGFNLSEAEIENIVIVRHVNNQRYGYKINLKPVLEGEETELFYLEPKDIVYVPRTKIAKLNQWIDQHINKIIPDTGLFFRRTSGRTTVGVGSYR